MPYMPNRHAPEYSAVCCTVQELNDRRLTLVEGSALSERDLVRTRAHSGSAILLLADRFSPSSHQEDLGLQFQVGIHSPLILSLDSQLCSIYLGPDLKSKC